jgi:hypothetical protein
MSGASMSMHTCTDIRIMHEERTGLSCPRLIPLCLLLSQVLSSGTSTHAAITSVPSTGLQGPILGILVSIADIPLPPQRPHC